MIPVQIEAAELSQALATGVASSFISSGSTGYDRKVWEHLSHYYKVNAWLPRNYVVANKQAWDGLDEATQAGVMKRLHLVRPNLQSSPAFISKSWPKTA